MEDDIASTTKAAGLDEPAAIISVRDLVKRYRIGKQEVRAIGGVTLDIRKGEFVAIVGASGSGKSTLLQMMGGLDKPTHGMVTINGVQIGKMSDRKLSIFRNQTIGFVFQFFYLQPFLNVRRNIEVAAMPNRMRRRERAERIEQLAAEVGLAERLRHRPRELSGGQIQRAAIARALVNRPSILLADEPTGNLDSQNSRDVVALFQQLRRDFGTTIVIATHDQSIARLADRIITVQDGMIV
jgi:ABC-type lipoprotein export system ATPase subunit